MHCRCHRIGRRECMSTRATVASSAAICTAELPAPTIETRAPANSPGLRYCATWRTRPPKASMPGIGGVYGASKLRDATMTRCARTSNPVAPRRESVRCLGQRRDSSLVSDVRVQPRCIAGEVVHDLIAMRIPIRVGWEPRGRATARTGRARTASASSSTEAMIRQARWRRRGSSTQFPICGGAGRLPCALLPANGSGRSLAGERGDQSFNAGADVVADRPHSVDALTGGVVELPVLVALARVVGAGVAAPHRDYDV